MMAVVRTGRVAAGASRRSALLQGAALIGAGALAAACAGTGTGAGSQPSAASKGPVTIRWSTWGDEKNPFNTTGVPEGMATFNKKFPNIKVDAEPQIGDWPPKITTEWIAGTGVDITGHCCDYSLGFARQGFLLKLDPYLKRDGKEVPTADYVDWLMKLFNSPDNGQFALPMYSGTVALMFNRNTFKAKGIALPDDTWDWNRYRDVALKLADPTNSSWARAEVGAGSMYRRFYQNGANAVDPKDDTKAAFASEKAIAAMEFERDTIHKDRTSVVTGGPKAAPATQGLDQYKQINAGLIHMWEGGAFTLTRYTQFLNDDVDWDVAPLPKGPVGRFTLVTNDGWSIWKGTKNPDATWELLKFLQSDEWTDIATRVAGQQSARRSFQQRWLDGIKAANPKLQSKNLKPFTDAIDKGYGRPIEFWRKDTDSKKVFTDAYNLAVRDGDDEVGKAMKAAAEQVNQINKG